MRGFVFLDYVKFCGFAGLTADYSPLTLIYRGICFREVQYISISLYATKSTIYKEKSCDGKKYVCVAHTYCSAQKTRYAY